jgi:hypothetical protein
MGPGGAHVVLLDQGANHRKRQQASGNFHGEINEIGCKQHRRRQHKGLEGVDPRREAMVAQPKPAQRHQKQHAADQALVQQPLNH